jgi:dihydroorotate dehydrogenase electron transfer subunit
LFAKNFGSLPPLRGGTRFEQPVKNEFFNILLKTSRHEPNQSPMIFQESLIQGIKTIAPDIYLLRFSSDRIASQALPGQFLMVRPSQFPEPLLPRPFSIHRVQGDHIDLLFKVVGQGTRQIAELKKGDYLEVRGPLGRGFVLKENQEPVLVAGGMGIAPLLFLAEFWKRNQKKFPKGLPPLFIGARTQHELLCLTEFSRAGIEIWAATEDGSLGEKGLVTGLLKKKLHKPSPNQALFVCGPNPMLKAIGNWAIQKGISCQLSLETRMACGLGACLGCVVARKEGSGFTYVNVCQEGPVFEAREVLWDD